MRCRLLPLHTVALYYRIFHYHSYCKLLQTIPLLLLLHTIEMRCTLCNANRICFITPNILNFWPTFRIAFRTTIKCILDCFTNIKILEIAIAQCWFLVLGPMETDVRKYVLLKNNSFPYQLLRNFASWANISKQNANCKLIPFISFHLDNEHFISHVFTKWFDAFISGFCLFITRQVKKQTTTCQRRGRR